LDFIIIWVLPAFILGGIGVILFFINHAHLQKAKKIAAWPTTQGVIERSSVERVHVRSHNRAGRPGHARIAYLPHIEYSYKVFGTPFRADGFEWSDRATPILNQSAAERLTAEYPPAKTVTVTYNPDQPEEAYLRINANPKRMERTRIIALGLIPLACLWVIAGAILRLNSGMRENALRGSPANLPVETAALRAGLDTLTSLVCTEGGAAGEHLNYNLQDCRASADPDALAIQIFIRVEEPEKTDLFTALVSSGDSSGARETLFLAAGWFFKEEARQTLTDWIRLNLPGVLVNGGIKKTKISGVKISLENLGSIIRFSIGELK
jgi:hypothetical protein